MSPDAQNLVNKYTSPDAHNLVNKHTSPDARNPTPNTQINQLSNQILNNQMSSDAPSTNLDIKYTSPDTHNPIYNTSINQLPYNYMSPNAQTNYLVSKSTSPDAHNPIHYTQPDQTLNQIQMSPDAPSTNVVIKNTNLEVHNPNKQTHQLSNQIPYNHTNPDTSSINSAFKSTSPDAHKTISNTTINQFSHISSNTYPANLVNKQKNSDTHNLSTQPHNNYTNPETYLTSKSMSQDAQITVNQLSDNPNNNYPTPEICSTHLDKELTNSNAQNIINQKLNDSKDTYTNPETFLTYFKHVRQDNYPRINTTPTQLIHSQINQNTENQPLQTNNLTNSNTLSANLASKPKDSITHSPNFNTKIIHPSNQSSENPTISNANTQIYHISNSTNNHPNQNTPSIDQISKPIKSDKHNLLDQEFDEVEENILTNLLHPEIAMTVNLLSRYKTSRDTLSPIINKIQPCLLLDSGADVSLIKVKFVEDLDINTQDKIKLIGIGKGSKQTNGSLVLELKLNPTLTIKHKFYTVANDFPIAEDGIIGRDFFTKFKIDILYSINKVRILDSLIPFSNQMIKQITLPARSETIVEIQTPSNEPHICIATELKSGIFVPHILLQPHNMKAKIMIANTLTEDATLTNFEPILEQVPNNFEYYIEQTYNTDRQSQIAQTVSESLDPSNNVEENVSILTLCLQYEDIFFIEGDKLSSIKGVQHNINLYTDSKPIHVQRYRLPQTHRDEINKQVKEMLADGKIQPSISPFNSPLLAVPKKPGPDGKPKWRVVVDFRKLNDITIGDSFPLPNINDILDQLGHAQYFSTLDMASGYHQIEMNPYDSHKTAFSTDYGHFEFTRMPFGLKNSQATFQRTINHILRGFQGIKGFIYLDDIIIHGKNLRDHNTKLKEVFDICRQNNLKLQSTKCQFLRKEITFLGHLITPAGIKPNPSTVKAVQEFPTPKNIRETQSFLGLANYYRRFIPRFSEIAEPLTKLTRKGTPFVFSDQCTQALNTLKDRLTQPPILKYPDMNRPFILTTDASDYSLGAVLSQIYPVGEFPVAYASRSLGKSERNYSTIEKEMLAIYWGVNNFRPYLYGRKFTIITDHKPLAGNLIKTPNRILKWNLKLSEYNFEIIHKSGKSNTNADALSRIKHNQINDNQKIDNQINAVTRAAAKLVTDTQATTNIDKNDTSTGPAISNQQKITHNSNPKIEVVIDPKKRQQILEEYHNLPLGGHAGTWRTYKRIRMLYYWPKMLIDINKFIRRCHLCKRNKSHRKTKAPLQITSTSEHPFQRVAFDIVGPLPTTEIGNNYLLTFQDDLSKFSGAIPIPDQTANTVAKALCEYYITKYGIPEKILTDQGSNFMSNTFKELCKLLKLKHLTTTAYHPETNGALEKSHNTLKEYLRSFTDISRNNWDEICHYATFVYNTTPHCSTNYTPYELVYGRPALIPSAIKREPEPIYNYDDYIAELKSKLQIAHEIARRNIINHKHKTKFQYDKTQNPAEFHIDDYVYLKNENRRTKQDPIWLGPYKVVELKSPVNTVIKINQKNVVVHNNRLIKQQS